MANEFGNVGAVASISETRMTAKNIETVTGLAEWEVYYNGTWRDVSSDFMWDITLAGNTILRAIRWDDGFRSYREDRGLILRKKEKEEEKRIQDEILPLGTTFAKAFGTSAAVALGVNTIRNTFRSAPVGVILGAAEIFAGMQLGKDPTKTKSEKLYGAFLTAGFSLGIATLPPKSRLFFIPAALLIQGVLKGEGIGENIAGTLGRVAGMGLGRSLIPLKPRPRPTPVVGLIPKLKATVLPRERTRTLTITKLADITRFKVAEQNIMAFRSISTPRPRVTSGSQISKAASFVTKTGFRRQQISRSAGPISKVQSKSLQSLAEILRDRWKTPKKHKIGF